MTVRKLGRRQLAGFSIVVPALLMLLAGASCGRAKPQAASGPDQPTPPSTDEGAVDGFGTRISAQSLRSRQDVPDDVADVLSYGEGGDNPCNGEGPEPFALLVAMPSYEEVTTIQRGWTTVICQGTGEGKLQHLKIVSPSGATLIDSDATSAPSEPELIPFPQSSAKVASGEISVAWISRWVGFEPLLGAELGEYTFTALIDSSKVEKTFEVVRAASGRVVVAGAPDVGEIGPGDIEVQLFGHDSAEGVDLDLYTSGSSEDDGVPYRFVHRSHVGVDDNGEAQVILERSGLDPGCWAVVANAPDSDHTRGDTGLELHVDYAETYYDKFCFTDA